MSVEKVHTSHPLFAQYPLQEFKHYYDNMKQLTKKRKETVDCFSIVLKNHFKTWRRKGPMTSHGNYFWDEKDARHFLKEDVTTGRVDEMSAEDFYNSNDEYKEFNEKVFRKHVNQEKSSQLGGRYWVPKRNRHGQKKHDEDMKRLRREFINNTDENIARLAAKYREMNAS